MIKLTTPETDAFDCELNNPRVLQDRYSEMLEHARKLERERDEARAAIVGWENKWKCAVEMAAQAEVERDEVREELAILKAECAKISEEFGLPPTVRPADGEIKRTINGWKEALRERDEAREERDILRLNSLGTIHLNIPVTTDWKEETK